MYLTRFLSRRG